jgi:uncharacterized protein YdaL
VDTERGASVKRGRRSAIGVVRGWFAGEREDKPQHPSGRRTLVLYDTSGDWGYLGELYAIQVANLASHFGAWTAKPVTKYRRGEMAAYAVVVYVGSSYDEPLPAWFLEDVLEGPVPVIWLNENDWKLQEHDARFDERYGWVREAPDYSAVAGVRYKGVMLPRDPENQQEGVASFDFLDRDRVDILAEAVRPDGSTFPWAVRSRTLTYVGEIPFRYATDADRQLVLADLLFDALAPDTTERHRAMVRLEDVGPDAVPDKLRAIAQHLAARNIPFGFSVYPIYRRPPARPIRLRDAPEVVAAIRELLRLGGTMVMHGCTHQTDDRPNPYDGRSGRDFEFFQSRIGPNGDVELLGPMPGDSAAWALERVAAGVHEFIAAGLPAPQIFEFPHYAASATDYRAITAAFAARYERGLYFSGLLGDADVDHTRMVSQAFPYVVRDVYGTKVVPENLGSVEGDASAEEIVARARRNLVVRDGIASFFYHPHLGLAALPEILDAIEGEGYRFTSPAVLEDPPVAGAPAAPE